MTITERKLSILNGTAEEEYGSLVTRKIRTRYSLSAELATLRKKERNPEAFLEYDAFAEKCKREARREIYGEEESE